MTVFAPSNKGIKSRGPTGWQAVNADAEARAAADAAREADPVERAVRYIRSRGRVIFRASVHGGPEDRWKHNGQMLDADAVIALADSIQRTLGLAGKSNPLPAPGQIRAVPPSSPVPASQPPVRQKAERPAAVKAPISTPPARATGKQEAPMPNPHVHTAQSAKKPAGLPSQDHWANERGTTAAAVCKDLADLKAVLGPAALADRLNTGKSSINNIILGHNTVGPTILAALYGESGCTLKPSLAALLASPAEKAAPAASIETAAAVPAEAAEVAQPLETKPEPPVETLASTIADAVKTFETGMAQVFGSQLSPEKPTDSVSIFPVLDLVPDMAQLNVADLLAGARRRREQLQAELADIDVQIRAVLKLAAVAA